MRYLITIILVVTIAALTQADVKHVKLRSMIGKFLKASFQHKTNCIAESMVSEDAVDQFWNHDYSGEDDQKLKCYLKCAYIKTHIIDEKGTLLVDELLHQNGVMHQLIVSHPDLLKQVIDNCRDPKSTDVCEAAYEMTQCGFKYIQELS